MSLFTWINVMAVVALSAEPECILPIDIVFLQDVTGSFKDDLPIVARQIPDIVQGVQETNPGSQWGIVSFRDKPYRPLGESDDLCYMLAAGLQTDPADVLEAWTRLRAGGGGDLPESQFTALINVALDERIGWRPLTEPNTRDTAKAAARLIIMSTDAIPHVAGDIQAFDPATVPELPQDLPPHWGGFTQDDPLNECRNYDYPTAYQVRDVLEEHDITLAILTPNTDPTVVGAWKWVNEDLLKQSPALYRHIEEDSSDLQQAIVQLVRTLTIIECEETTTTDEPTSTTTDVEPTTTHEPTTTTTTHEPTTATVTESTSEPTTTSTELTTTTESTFTSSTFTSSTFTSSTFTSTIAESTTTELPTTKVPTATTDSYKTETRSTEGDETTAIRFTVSETYTTSTRSDCPCAHTCAEQVCHCDCCDDDDVAGSADKPFLSGMVGVAIDKIDVNEVMLLAVPKNPKGLHISYDN